MKKYILPTLCSALVVPGLGQIINKHVKKGLCIMAIVFILLVLGTVKLALVLRALFDGMGFDRLDAKVLAERIQGEDFIILWVLFILFGMVWIYSVVDAFRTGMKIENQAVGTVHEILPDR